MRRDALRDPWLSRSIDDTLSGMENQAIRDTARVAPLVRLGERATRRRDPREPLPTAIEAAGATSHASDGDPDTLRVAKDRAEQPARPINPFQAIMCANERTAAD